MKKLRNFSRGCCVLLDSLWPHCVEREPFLHFGTSSSVVRATAAHTIRPIGGCWHNGRWWFDSYLSSKHFGLVPGGAFTTLLPHLGKLTAYTGPFNLCHDHSGREHPKGHGMARTA